MDILVPEVLRTEMQIDKGFDTDTFFIINSSGTPYDTLLDRYDGVPTVNGKIRVVHRDNVGISFGGYLDTFNKYSSEYDYWFFVEDDVIVYREGYVKAFIDELEKTDATFIALSPISTYIKPHCGGGCGLTSTNYMREIYSKDKVDSLLTQWAGYSGYDVAANSLRESNAEIEFTSRFNLRNHHKYSPICENFSKGHSTQRRFATHYNLNELEFIYKVGIR
ncbi:hypothetical protein OAA02_00130 [bacterium]|nr:hypothetical protein [bacterium]